MGNRGLQALANGNEKAQKIIRVKGVGLMQETFFCCACLKDRPMAEQSRNRRYCSWCHEFMKRERELSHQPEPVDIAPDEPQANSGVVNEQKVVVTKRRKYVRRKQG